MRIKFKFRKKSFAKLLFLFFCLSLILVSCIPHYDRAEQAYNVGDYDTAVDRSVEKLQKKPSDEKSIEMLVTALPLAYKKHQEAAEKSEASLNWERAAIEYARITRLVDKVSSLPPILHPQTKQVITFPKIDVKAREKVALQNAAEAHYREGLRLETTDPKAAAEHFRKASELIANYKDAKERYAKTRKAGTQRIAIMPFENLTGKYGQVGHSLTDLLISQALHSQPEFLEFVTRDYLEQLIKEQKLGLTGIIDETTAPQVGKLLGIRYFVFGKVHSIVPNYPRTASDTLVKEFTRYTSGEPPRKIRGVVTVYTAKGSVRLKAGYQIIDVNTGTIAASDILEKEAVSEYKWARLTGDPESLDWEKDLRELTEKPPGTPDPPEVVLNQALEMMSQEMSQKLLEFFK